MRGIVKVRSNGNSIGINIPAPIRKQHGIEEGDALIIDDEQWETLFRNIIKVNITQEEQH